MSLLVIVPTRGRPEQCERLLKSFRETAQQADILFVLDPDDAYKYANVDWGDALQATLAPRGTLQEKLNHSVDGVGDAYSAYMWCGDDHVFRTPKWDTIMLAVLDKMGGSGWVYPDTVRRRDVPEIWMCSADVIAELGWFFPPAMSMYYGDNAIAELGKRSGLIWYSPQAVIEHLHYSVNPGTVHDETYSEAEKVHGTRDMNSFLAWKDTQLPLDAARLRRKFNPDIEWVLGRF